MYDLPSEDPEEPGLPDEFHDLQPQLLTRTLRLSAYSPEQIFTGSDLLYYDLHHPLWHKRPDWFMAVGVSRLYDGHDLRSSYVVWQEEANPYVVVELLSPGTEGEDLGTAPQTPDAPPCKWDVYEKLLRVPYYAVFDRRQGQLRAFRLSGGSYQEEALDTDQPRFWIPELAVGLGIWQGAFEGIQRSWLRWYDTDGNWILTDAEQERQNAEQERQKRRSLTEKLQALSPEQLEALGISLEDLT